MSRAARQGEIHAAKGLCVCGAQGKPTVMSDGRTGYICPLCFMKIAKFHLSGIAP